MPLGEVKLWELKSGLYRVSSGVTIKASTTKSLPRNAKPYSYLYVSGKSYTGSTDQRYVVGWAYLVSELYNGSSDTKVYTGSTYENGIEKEPAAELATAKKLAELETKLGNEFETALLEKVNKSDILSNIDKNAEFKDIYNAPAVNVALSTLEDLITSINERLSAIDGGINEISALVGGA